MRIAYWSPLPPEPTGIADFSIDLLSELRRYVEITAIVRDPRAGNSVPPGVALELASAYRPERFDWDIYQIGNHMPIHRYIYTQAMRRPGIVTLHDPALFDFHAGFLGGFKNDVFIEEMAFNCDGQHSIPILSTEDGEEPDRLAMMMSRRLVEASALTVVHSLGIRDELRRRWPGVNVEQIPLATKVLDFSERPEGSPAVFGIFGGISRHKRVLVGLHAFLEARRDHPEIQLIIAGRADEPKLVHAVESLVATEAPEGSVNCRIDVALAELEQLILSVDVVIAQRWPTAGETSASLMRAFGAGRMVLASDVLQNREFASEFCKLVSVEPREELRSLTKLLNDIAENPEGARRAGRTAREFVRDTATPQVAAETYLRHIRSLDRSTFSTSAIAASPRDIPQINAIASWASTTGLTEAGRRATLAALDAGVNVAIEDYDFGSPRDPRRFPGRFASLAKGRPFPIDLYFLNVNEFQVLSEEYICVPDHYLIGWWYWELPSIPRHIQSQLSRVNEIWVASEFVRDAFAQYTRAHIEVLPCVVEPKASPTVSLRDFGIPSDRCVFLFHFDANSTLARKNPWGVIDAYRHAFSHAERQSSTHLVIKTINLQSLEEARVTLTERIEEVGGTLIEEELSTGEMGALAAGCDVFVSLHRAEGFGLGIAEAMYFGRPVIATAYSGNVDFTDARNSCQVSYTLRPINVDELRFNPDSEHIYEPGLLWAEPNLDQAVRWMRLLFDHPELRTRVGSAGQRTIRDHMSSSAVGHAVRGRLDALLRTRR